MARKGENIYKRKDGRWEARYEKGRNSKGQIIYGSLYGKSYREVREKKINSTDGTDYEQCAFSSGTCNRICADAVLLCEIHGIQA